MSVFKEIERADGSGITQFFRLSSEKQTVETKDYGDFYKFKGGVVKRDALPKRGLVVGDAYYIEEEGKTVFWDGSQWIEINAYVLNYNYNDASNKPKINGKVLAGNRTAEELELQPAGNYLTEIPAEYITESELEDYNYADKTFVMESINKADYFHKEIVSELPTTGKDNVIYMIKKQKGAGKSSYDEYIWVGAKYELIGNTETDLSDYYTKEEANKLLGDKVDSKKGFGLSSNDFTLDEKNKLLSLQNYDDGPIWGAVRALHNYDDTQLRKDITALKTAKNDLLESVNRIDSEVSQKVGYVRLVKAGDKWSLLDDFGDVLEYEDIRDALGQEKTFLILEDVENDGKMLPSRYNIDEDFIHVWYVDIRGVAHYVKLSANGTEDKVLGEASRILGTVETIPASGNIGDMVFVGPKKELYVYNGTEWKLAGSNAGADLSNYLAKNNTTGYEPVGDFNPATKKYVDRSVAEVKTKVEKIASEAGEKGPNIYTGVDVPALQLGEVGDIYIQKRQ